MSEKSWSDAWSERYEEPAAARPRRGPISRLRGRGGSRPGRYAVLAAVVIAVVAAPFAVAAGKGSFTASDARYTVLARNTSNGDGGALAAACTSNASTPSNAHEPCLNMVNKGTGYAAAFRTRGIQGFRLQTSGSGTATPFILDKNATGKVTYFNADQLDGLDSSDFNRERWGLIDGTTNPTTPAIVRDKGVASVSRTAAGDYAVTFDDDVNNCSYQVTPANGSTARAVSAVPVTGQNKQVRVTVRDVTDDTAPAADLVDDSFQIAVHC